MEDKLNLTSILLKIQDNIEPNPIGDKRYFEEFYTDLRINYNIQITAFVHYSFLKY